MCFRGGSFKTLSINDPIRNQRFYKISAFDRESPAFRCPVPLIGNSVEPVEIKELTENTFTKTPLVGEYTGYHLFTSAWFEEEKNKKGYFLDFQVHEAAIPSEEIVIVWSTHIIVVPYYTIVRDLGKLREL